MSDFKIVTSANEIQLNNEKWRSVDSFKGYHIDGSYTEKGKEAGSDYEGRRYTIISIRVRNFSGLERFGRGLLGIAAVICSLGLALFSESVRNLFISSEKGICFAKKIEESELDNAEPTIEFIEMSAPWADSDDSEEPSPLPEKWQKHVAEEEISGSTENYSEIKIPKGDSYFTYEGKIAIGLHGTYNPPSGM